MSSMSTRLDRNQKRKNALLIDLENGVLSIYLLIFFRLYDFSVPLVPV